MRLGFSDGCPYVPQISGIRSAPTQSIATVAAQGAATTTSILGGISAATTAAGSGLLAGFTVFGMAASAALPLIGAAITGLVAIGIAIANQFKGCGQTCIEASQIADQVGTYLGNNLNTYLASPVHYASMQAAALNNFDTAWAALMQACGDPSLQQAGQNCISERQQGACAYKTSGQGWVQDSSGNWSYQASQGNGSGDVCWNWFVGYRDPIANDPTVVPDPVSPSDVFDSGTSGAVSSTTSSDGNVLTNPGGDLLPLALGAGLLLFALMD